MSMTDQELDAWTAALRSGNYKQCSRELYRTELDGGGYCCIGVAFDVIKPNGETCETMDNDDDDPTQFAISRLGIPNDPAVSGKLVSMNDDEKLDFLEIADWIDANRELFRLGRVG